MTTKKKKSSDFSKDLLLIKHSPKNLDEFKGNRGVVQTLGSFIEAKNIPNLIITGPHGTGKSTLVKLMIQEYLGEEYFKTGSLEIYGSLSRGIDVVSEKPNLKNKKKNFDCTNITDFMKKMTNMPVHLLKIVIIYEFHQMSTEAQMALRRIMELNSNRVRFVFVTQEYGQIIQALQSRCTILKLQKLDQDEMSNILQTICQKENIVVSQELYDLIYLNTDGDIKAAVNLLQILGKTDLESIYNILGVPETEVIQQIILNCDQGNTQLAYKKVRSLLEGGFDISDLLDLLTRVLVKSNSFPNKNEFLRSLCHDTFTIQECYTETQFYNLINHLGEIGSKN